MSPLIALQSPLLAGAAGIRHAFFTRQGGVSRGVYDSLNLGRGSRDDPAAVAENRRRAAGWFAVEPAELLIAYQIHSATAHIVGTPWNEAPQGDGVVTATPGLACGALAADCAPVLIADPQSRIAAAAHAGWRGALGGVVAATVEAMQTLGARPDRMIAAVGPCIGPASYEVGPEFVAQFVREAPGCERFFQAAARPDKAMFDLPAFVLERLAQAGVAQAEWIGRDTLAEETLFFSNRRGVLRGEADYGRLLSAIMIEA